MGFVIWWMASQATPTIRIPTPTLPNPNAFDTYILATTQLLESRKIDNAHVTRSGVSKGGVAVLPLRSRETLMAENSLALATIRSGLEQPYYTPPLRSFYTRLPFYAKFRGLARFLAVDSAVRAEKGDYPGAARSGLDAVEMGGQFPRGATLIGGLVGIACQSIGREPVWQIVDRLDAKSALAGARRLDRIRRSEVSYAETLQEEEWLGQSGLMEFFGAKSSGGGISTVAPWTQNGSSGTTFMPLSNSLFFMVYSKHRIMDDYTTYLNAEIREAKKPYAARRSKILIPHDFIVEQLVASLDGCGFKWAENETQNGMLELSLALRAFRLRHGAYPHSLAELTPGILPSLPTDPFAQGRPFCYRLSGTSYLLYSVGPDGKDDGGRPINAGASPPDGSSSGFIVKLESTGDIVAGQNIR